MTMLKTVSQEITIAELARLFNPPASLAVSLFMPTQRPGVEGTQEPLRLRNLLHSVEERLITSRVYPSEIEQWLAPVYASLADPLFWRHPGHGLAIYLSSNCCYTLRLPYACEDQVVIGRHFQIRPLLPMLNNGALFYLLALSQNSVRLYRCTSTTSEEIVLDDVPTNLAEALRYDEFDRGIQMHSQGSPAQGKRAPAMVHGQGSASESAVTKKYLQRFLQELDHGICEMLDPEGLPLITAGVGYIRSLYRQVSHYAHLLDDGIEGNVDRQPERELHKAAVEVMTRAQQAKQISQAQRLNELLGMGDRHALADVDNALRAAYQGRIDTLLLSKTASDWGAYDPALDLVEHFAPTQVEADDLINVAAIYTLQNKGVVLPMNGNEIPTSAKVAAILRY